MRKRILWIFLLLFVKVVVLQSPILKEFMANSNGVGLSVCVSKGLLYVSHWFNTINVWDIASGNLQTSIPSQDIPFDIACNNDYLIVAAKSTITIRKLDGSSTINVGRPSPGQYTSVILAGNIVIALKDYGEISTHNLLDGSLLHFVDNIPLQGPDYESFNMAVGFSSLFFSFGKDLLEYDLQTLSFKKKLYSSAYPIRSIAICESSNAIVVGQNAPNTQIQVLDIANGQIIRSFNSPPALEAITCFQGLLFVGSNNGQVYQYDILGTPMQTYSCKSPGRVLKTTIHGSGLFTAELVGNMGGSTMFNALIAMIKSIHPNKDLVPYEQSLITINLFAPANSLNISQIPSISVGMQPCTNISWVNASMLTCNLPVVQGNPAQVLLDLTNSGLPIVLTSNVRFAIPRIQSISPNTANCTTSSIMTLKVDNLADPTRDPPVVFIGNDICKNSLQQGNSTITCQIPWGPKPGPVFVIVKVKGINSIVNETVFFYQKPVVTKVIHNNKYLSIDVGDQVSLVGYNFGACLTYPCYDKSLISIFIGNGSCYGIEFISDSLLNCSSPGGVNRDVGVRVVIDQQESLTNNFVSFAPPTLTNVDPIKADGETGQSINVEGSNFNSDLKLYLIKVKDPSIVIHCPQLTVTGRSTLLFKLPGNLERVLYRLLVTQGNQESVEYITYKNYLNGVPEVPEETRVNCFQDDGFGFNQVSINMTFTDEDNVLADITFQIEVLPVNGKLYRPGSSGSPNVLISSPGFALPKGSQRVIYIPNKYYVGEDSFNFTARDLSTTPSKAGTIKITVQATNQRPYVNVAVKKINVLQNETKKIDLECFDIENNPLSFNITANPFKGRLLNKQMVEIVSLPYTLDDNSVFYQPYLFELGQDYASFNYTCFDNSGLALYSPGAMVVVSVLKSSFPPTAFNVETSILETGNATIIFNGTDLNNEPLTFTIATIPSKGDVFQFKDGDIYTEADKMSIGAQVLDPLGRIFYKPKQHGMDEFQFRVVNSNNKASTQNGIVKINVEFVNQKPVIGQVIQEVGYSRAESETITPMEISFSASDRDDTANLTAIIVAIPEKGKISENNDGSLPLSVGSKVVLKKSENGNNIQAKLYYQDSDNGGWFPPVYFTYIIVDSGNMTADLNGTVKIAVSCTAGKANRIWATAGAPCGNCLDGGICYLKGEQFPTNKDGYFPDVSQPDSTDKIRFVPCAAIEACPQGSFKPEFMFLNDSGMTCGPGYKGSRCGECVSNYTSGEIYYRRGVQCLACPKEKISNSVIVLFVIGGLLGLLILINIIKKVDLGFISILITFLQTVSIFASFKLQWPEDIRRVYHSISFFNFNIELAAPECYVIPDNSKSYEYKWFSSVAMPIALLAVILLVLVVYFILYKIYLLLRSIFRFIFCMGKSKEKESKSNNVRDSADLGNVKEPSSIKMKPLQVEGTEKALKEYKVQETLENDSMKKDIPHLILPISLLNSYILYLKFMYLSLSKKIVELFNCLHVGGKYYFEAEPNRSCYEEWWYNLLPYDIAGLVLYVVGIPALMVYLYFRRLHLLNNVLIKDRTSFDKFILVLTFKPKSEFKIKYEFWDTYLAIRKLLVILVQLFFSKYSIFQAIFLSLVLTLALFLQLYLSPYSIVTLNFLEFTTILATVFILQAGVLFRVQEFDEEREVKTLAYFVITIIAGSIFLVFMALLLHVKTQIRTYNEQKREAQQKQRKDLHKSRELTDID